METDKASISLCFRPAQGHQRGFTLIELMVVLVIMAVVWVAVLPMIQPDQQRQGRDWLVQAQAMLSLSCDLSAQTLQTQRVLWQNQQLVMQQWVHGDWHQVRDVDVLTPPDGWSLLAVGDDRDVKKNEPIAWLCHPDGEQTAGRLLLSRTGLGKLVLSWQGDGRYEQTAGL